LAFLCARQTRLMAVLLVCFLTSPIAARAEGARHFPGKHSPLEVLVLGSGGPRAFGRAATSYIVLVDGVPRILVDAGPGAFPRWSSTATSCSARSSRVCGFAALHELRRTGSFLRRRREHASTHDRVRTSGPACRDAGTSYPQSCRMRL